MGPHGPDHHADAGQPLAIGGGPAGLIPQDQVAQLVALVPDASLVTVDAGHLVHESRPEEFLAVLREFPDR